MPVRLHVRALVLALAVMLVVPTLGQPGADDAPSAAATAAMAAADAPQAPEPADDPAPTAAAEEVADHDGATPGEVQEAPAPAAEDTAPQAAEAPAATADAPAKAQAQVQAQAKPEADTPGKAADAPKKKAPAAAKKGAKGKQAAAASPQRGRAAPARTAASASGSVRTLYLAVGHGRAPDGQWQRGASNSRTGNYEEPAARLMVDEMRKVLAQAPNLEVVAEGRNHPNMIGSVARANALGVDDCIEVHQDMAAAPPGAFVHWYPGAGSAEMLANRIVYHLRDAGVQTRHDWHRARGGLYFLRKSECRSVLVEVGRVGDFGPKKLRQLGRKMARAYLIDTAQARGVAAG